MEDVVENDLKKCLQWNESFPENMLLKQWIEFLETKKSIQTTAQVNTLTNEPAKQRRQVFYKADIVRWVRAMVSLKREYLK